MRAPFSGHGYSARVNKKPHLAGPCQRVLTSEGGAGVFWLTPEIYRQEKYIPLITKAQHFLVFLPLVFLAWFAQGQDVSFSQFYAHPLYLNPAFAGSLGVPRINLQYRDQWHALPGAYVTQSLSFDLPVPLLQGGLGFHLVRDAQAEGLLKTLETGFIYASHFRVGEKWRVSGALEAGYHHHRIDWARLVFADNVDPYRGEHLPSAEIPPADQAYGYADFSTGLLLYGERLFTGLAVHHLSEPAQSWYRDTENSSRLYRKYTLHLGTRIPIHGHGYWRKTFDLSPQVVLMQQGPFRQFNYGMLANYHGFTGGAWLRQDLAFRYDALIFLVGYMKKRWHFTYSYDFTLSGLGARSGGTSEISLSFLLRDFTQDLAFPFYRPYKDYIGE